MSKRDPAQCSGQFQSFDFLFGVAPGERVLSLADNLSRSLQKKCLSAVEGQAMAALTIQSLKALHTDHEFGFFWRELMTWQMATGVDEPSLPRRRKVPSHLETGESSSGHFPSTVEDHYQHIYFAALEHYCTVH